MTGDGTEERRGLSMTDMWPSSWGGECFVIYSLSTLSSALKCGFPLDSILVLRVSYLYLFSKRISRYELSSHLDCDRFILQTSRV
jgi:hypothetical protein